MKKHILILISLLTAASFTIHACGGFRYLDAEPLEFHDIDYGFETHFLHLQSKGLSIAYIDEGDHDQTILLVHGLASNAGFWRYNIEDLSRDYRVIAIDLPGYGKSDKGDYPYGMRWYAEVIQNFIEEMDFGPVIYIGHSMGGQIGTMLSLHHPESLNKLVLAAPAGIESFSPGAGNWLRNAFTMKGIKNAPESAIRSNLSLNFHRWDSRWEWMVEERARMAKVNEMDEFAYTVVQCVGAMLDEPTTHLLEYIRHETLIIYGKYDGLIPNMYLNPGSPAAVFAKGHEKITNSTLVEIDRAGHMLQIEKPEAFTAGVLNWLRP